MLVNTTEHNMRRTSNMSHGESSLVKASWAKTGKTWKASPTQCCLGEGITFRTVFIFTGQVMQASEGLDAGWSGVNAKLDMKA